MFLSVFSQSQGVVDILLKNKHIKNLFDNSEYQLILISELAKVGKCLLGNPNGNENFCRLIEMPIVNSLQKFMSESEVEICSDLMVDPDYLSLLHRCYYPELWQQELHGNSSSNNNNNEEDESNYPLGFSR